jgi:hypothetical protein
MWFFLYLVSGTAQINTSFKQIDTNLLREEFYTAILRLEMPKRKGVADDICDHLYEKLSILRDENEIYIEDFNEFNMICKLPFAVKLHKCLIDIYEIVDIN